LGYTKTPVVTFNLTLGTHQLKVAIADGIDLFLDAAVLIRFLGAVHAPTAAPVSAPVPVLTVGKMRMKMMMT
jgi:hypothetical protein